MRNLLKQLLGNPKLIESDSFNFAINFMKRKKWIVVGCMVVLVPAHAASFDCTKAASKIEKLICETPVISKLDSDLAKVYQEALINTSDEQKQRLVLDQKHWIKYTRNLCEDDACVKQTYEARLKEIAALNHQKTKVVVADAVKDVHTSQPLKGEPQTSKIVPISYEEMQGLLNIQTIQLQTKQKSARDVLFFRGGMPQDGTGFCERFWRALGAQVALDIPKPNMLAVQSQEKEKIFESLHDFAKNNFNRYLVQDGKLTPDKYIDEEGRAWRLGPFVKGTSNSLKDLPQKFQDVWQKNPDYHGFFDKTDLFDQRSSILMLYMQPYPIVGFVRPLLVTVQKDVCNKCTGISMGVRSIAVDGLPQPDWIKGKYFSQASYAEAEAQSISRNTSKPLGPYLLMGMSSLDGKLIFWNLKKQIWVEPSPREIENDIHYYKRGDAKDYFRNYEVDLFLLDEPRYEGPRNTCTIKFN